LLIFIFLSFINTEFFKDDIETLLNNPDPNVLTRLIKQNLNDQNSLYSLNQSDSLEDSPSFEDESNSTRDQEEELHKLNVQVKN
jgi:hypothetical protein